MTYKDDEGLPQGSPSFFVRPTSPKHGNNYHLSTFRIPDSLSLLLMRLSDDL